MWPKGKFGAQIFVTDVMLKFMCKKSVERSYTDNMTEKSDGKLCLMKDC